MVALLPALLLLAADGPPADFQPLRFVPQETVSTVHPTVPPEILSLALRVEVADDRGLPEPNAIGQGTDRKDRTFPVMSAGDIRAFVEDTARGVLTGWGFTLAEGGIPLRLTLKRFWVAETNQAVGATYRADVAFWWETGGGRTRGAVAGSATRYGRAKSEDNRNEVLSDALKDALANLASHPAVHRALGEAEAPAREPAVPTEQRLRRLKELLDQGLITPEEYDRKKAEILREL